jgi:hypothetical protein
VSIIGTHHDYSNFPEEELSPRSLEGADELSNQVASYYPLRPWKSTSRYINIVI